MSVKFQKISIIPRKILLEFNSSYTVKPSCEPPEDEEEEGTEEFTVDFDLDRSARPAGSVGHAAREIAGQVGRDVGDNQEVRLVRHGHAHDARRRRAADAHRLAVQQPGKVDGQVARRHHASQLNVRTGVDKFRRQLQRQQRRFLCQHTHTHTHTIRNENECEKNAAVYLTLD